MRFHCTYPVTMEQVDNKHHFNLQPAMSHCNYMEQGGNKHHMKQEYLSPIFKQKLQ